VKLAKADNIFEEKKEIQNSLKLRYIKNEFKGATANPGLYSSIIHESKIILFFAPCKYSPKSK